MKQLQQPNILEKALFIAFGTVVIIAIFCTIDAIVLTLAYLLNELFTLNY